ncbi:MAG: uncharacterized protein KVP18_003228 [Porospora cf. gigantea A]|uniref:uncharacterized protein n=1 Tax=Porospora cf. gigantea A TaxID=2853593 RepID=UPI003559AA5C|nr:MAG: hypothetical protein KVP18_003228 [Porospora cf. gigantea A]
MLLLPHHLHRPLCVLCPEEHLWQLLGSLSLPASSLVGTDGRLFEWVEKSRLRTDQRASVASNASRPAACRAGSLVERVKPQQVEESSRTLPVSTDIEVGGRAIQNLNVHEDCSVSSSDLPDRTSAAFRGLGPVYGVASDDRNTKKITACFDLEALMSNVRSVDATSVANLARQGLFTLLVNSCRSCNVDAVRSRSRTVSAALASTSSVSSIVARDVLIRFVASRPEIAEDLCFLCDETGKMIHCVLEHFSSLEAACETTDFSAFVMAAAARFEALHQVDVISAFVVGQLLHYTGVGDFRRGARKGMLLSNVFWIEHDGWFRHGLEMEGLYQSPYMMKSLWPALQWIKQRGVQGPWSTPGDGFYPHITFDLDHDPLDRPSDIFPPFITYLRCMHTVYQMRRRGDDVEIEDDDEVMAPVSTTAESIAHREAFLKRTRERHVDDAPCSRNSVDGEGLLELLGELLSLEEEVDFEANGPFKFPESLVTCFLQNPTTSERLLSDFLRFLFWELRSGDVELKELNVCACQTCRKKRFEMFAHLKNSLVLHENGKVDVPLDISLKNMTVLVKEVMLEYGVKNEGELQSMLAERANQGRQQAEPVKRKKRPATKMKPRRR